MNYIEETITRAKNWNVPIALVDVDGVMLDNTHRLHHIVHTVDGKQTNRPDADWHAFHSLSHKDPIGAFAPIARMLDAGRLNIIFLTARVEIHDQVRNNLVRRLDEATWGGTYGLIMRPQKPVEVWTTEGPSVHSDFKRVVVQRLVDEGLKILLAVDDSHANCKVFKELGIPTLRFYNHLTEDQYLY